MKGDENNMPRGRKKVVIKTIEEQIIEVGNKIEELEKELETMELKLDELNAKKREQDLALLTKTMKKRGISVNKAVEIIENADIEDNLEDIQEDN